MLGYSGFDFLYVISNILIGLFFASALVAAYTKKELRKNFVFCLFLFFIPIVCIFFFSRVFFPIYLDRALIIFSPYFYLILSLGIFFLSKKARLALFTILMSVILIVDYGYFKDWMFMPFEHHMGTYIKKPIKPILKFLKKSLQLQDIIAFTNESTLPSFNYYIQDKSYPIYFFFDPKIPDTNWARLRQESRRCLPFYKVNNLKFKRLWIISSDWERSGNLDKNSQTVKNWLDKNFRLEFVTEFDGLRIFRYVKS
jgi:hypothetical protein